MTLTEPPGLIAAVVGGLIGAAGGLLLAVYAFQTLLPTDGTLADLGWLLLALATALVAGPVIGATTALVVFGHGRALATGAWLIPFVIAAVFAMYRILDSIDGLAPLLHGILLVPVPLSLMVAAIWMARSIATNNR
jgi:hypothetical protein